MNRVKEISLHYVCYQKIPEQYKAVLILTVSVEDDMQSAVLVLGFDPLVSLEFTPGASSPTFS